MTYCGLAGLDTSGVRALCGIAGEIKGRGQAALARAGVAGNLTGATRRTLPDLIRRPGESGSRRLGDRAASECWQRGVYFSDYTYIICTADRGKGETLRWRRGREKVFGRRHRALPLFLDSAAYRRWTGTTPRWTSFDTYLAAIELADPDGFAAYDVIGDQAASLRYFDAMCGVGYGPDRGCFPVYHVRPKWRDDATVTGVVWRNIPAAARCAVANARIAARDPVLRYYASQSRLIGLGGMVRGPIPRAVRHYYIAELCRQLPEHQFWGLGQANYKVVNGLGAMGLLDRVWTDGTWYILDAACERFAVVMDGRIVMHSLEGIARSFFSLDELLVANLRSLLSAYSGLWEWPPPDPLPLDQHDEEQAVELHARFTQAKLELFGDGEVRVYGNVPVRVTEQ